MKKTSKIIFLILGTGLISFGIYKKESSQQCNLNFYVEIRNKCITYPYSEWIDSLDDKNSVVLSRPSHPFSFIYTMNLGIYDSIYYFGQYPSLEFIRKTKPDISAVVGV